MKRNEKNIKKIKKKNQRNNNKNKNLFISYIVKLIYSSWKVRDKFRNKIGMNDIVEPNTIRVIS